MQKRDFETYQKRFRDFEILLKFPRPTFFEVPFSTPYFPPLSIPELSSLFCCNFEKKLMIIIIKSKENEEC